MRVEAAAYEGAERESGQVLRVENRPHCAHLKQTGRDDRAIDICPASRS
jgi:hypothetical protein